MTVATQTNFVVYEGDDVAVTFPYTFPVYDADHMYVYLQDTTTKELTLLSSSAYTVNGVGDENGGSVVTDDPVSLINKIILARILPLTQDLDVLNQGGFYPENFELELDLEEMQIQQLQEEIGRTVRGQLTEAWPQLPPPPIRRDKLLGFTDDEFAYPTVDTVGILVDMLMDILQAGFGISITRNGDHIIITNTAPGGDATLDCWLLEDATAGGGGGGGGSGDAEFILDTVAAALIGDGVTIDYDDAGDTITLTVTGSVDAEAVYDAIAAAITAGSGIIVANDDTANTTTISADPEFIRDTIGTALVGGPGVTSTVDDAGNTITLTTDPKILSTASAATVTPTFAYDQVNITAQAAGLTLANPTGTSVDGHGIIIRIKDNGTSRAISYGTKYRAFNDALPTATTINKTLYLGMVYNSADDKWDVLAVRLQA